MDGERERLRTCLAAAPLRNQERAGMMNLGTASDPADRRAPSTGAVELSNELLRMVSDVLDVRDVFPRIAQTASRLLQHDCLDLMVHDPCGNAMLRTRSAEDFPEDRPEFV